jgi:dipeptidyl-peptidase-4
MRNLLRLSLLLLLNAGSGQLFSQRNITLEDIWKNGTFRARGVQGFYAMNDGERFVRRVNNALMAKRFDQMNNAADTGKVVANLALIGDPQSGKPVSVEGFAFSEDEKKLLVWTNTEQIYRHSFAARYYVFDLNNFITKAVAAGPVMHATLSPDGSKVAYVQENNLFVLNLQTNEQIQVTRDGKRNAIINGAVDWVYEEEFSMNEGFRWSPDSRHIAFYRFDESSVREFSMDMYTDLYPQQYRWKYPKAGEDNSKVDVMIYHVETGRIATCNVESSRDQYIPRIQWTATPGTLSVQRLNRLQNHWELLFFSADGGEGSSILSLQSDTYIDIHDNLRFLQNGREFLYTDDRDGYNHVWMFDYRKGKTRRITEGSWEVVSLDGVNEKDEVIYYTSTEGGATEMHTYSIRFNGKGKKNLTPEPGNHAITMAKGNRWFIDRHSTLAQPETILLRNTDCTRTDTLEKNEALRKRMQEFNWGSTRFGTLLTREGVSLNYWMILPPNFDSSKRYPLFMHVYGGPGANTVNNRWSGSNYLWHQMLAQQGYIVVSVDNRGTGNRGAAFKKATYLKLGELEQIDQAGAARYFGNLPYVDNGRIGIWGWSFGGYLSSLCLAKSPEVFKMAIAVAPVTSWRYYDNIYTERYLRKPQDNAAGYDNNSPIQFVRNIKGSYLLVHGTADDNVHFQNAAEMVHALVEANIDFDSEFYTDHNHGIYGGNARLHLYRRMTRFVLEKL